MIEALKGKKEIAEAENMRLKSELDAKTERLQQEILERRRLRNRVEKLTEELELAHIGQDAALGKYTAETMDKCNPGNQPKQSLCVRIKALEEMRCWQQECSVLKSRESACRDEIARLKSVEQQQEGLMKDIGHSVESANKALLLLYGGW